MTVELLWWDGCPSIRRRSTELERILREEGVDAEWSSWKSRVRRTGAAGSFPGIADDPHRW